MLVSSIGSFSENSHINGIENNKVQKKPIVNKGLTSFELQEKQTGILDSLFESIKKSIDTDNKQKILDMIA
ncbi:hypothetical protein J6G99_05110 [bacterium]|nr:hypothetical protein [bacterium]